jgi:hypothetical protein
MMGIAARLPDPPKNKADIVFKMKIKAEYKEIKAMEDQLENNKGELAFDEAILDVVNGWRLFGETIVGPDIGFLEEEVQYRAALKVCDFLAIHLFLLWPEILILFYRVYHPMHWWMAIGWLSRD